MKKPLGYPPMNLLTLPTLSPISIPNILPNPALFPFNKICPSIFIPFHCVSILSSLLHSIYYLFHLIPFYYSFPLSYIPSFVHTKNKVKKNKKQNNPFNSNKVQNFMIHYNFLGDRSRPGLLLPVSIHLLTISLHHHLLCNLLYLHLFLLLFSLLHLHFLSLTLLHHSLLNLPL